MKKAEEKKETKEVESRWKRWGKRAALWGAITLNVLLKGKDVKAQTPVVKDAKQQNSEVSVTPKSTKADTIVFGSALSKDEMLLNQAVADLSDNPEFVASLLEENGLNTLNNFNFKGMNLSTEEIQCIKNDGPMSLKMKKNKGKFSYLNNDGSHCAAYAFAVINNAAGFHPGVSYAYQAANVLANKPSFTEIPTGDDYGNLSSFDDMTVVVQDRNEKDLKHVYAGHILLIETRDGVKAQDSGKNGPKGLPKDTRRNSYSHYGKRLRAFVPSDGHVKELLLVRLVEEDRCTVKIDSVVKAYIFDNPQIAKQYGITNLEALKNPKIKNLKAQITVRKQHQADDVDVNMQKTASGEQDTYAAYSGGSSVFLVKNNPRSAVNKAPRKEDIEHRGNSLSKYMHKIRSRQNQA